MAADDEVYAQTLADLLDGFGGEELADALPWLSLQVRPELLLKRIRSTARKKARDAPAWCWFPGRTRRDRTPMSRPRSLQ